MSVNDGTAHYGPNWKDLDKAPTRFTTTGGWLGFTDKYWLATLIPDQSKAFDGQFRAGAGQTYQADYTLQPQTLAPGRQVTQTTRFFAGAKEVALLDRYTDKEGATKLDYALDWGYLRVLEKPIFYYLDWLFRLVGNFGVAIILLTVTIRALMFPIAQRQFASMAAMRAVQPKMKALQERYKDDKVRMQQEVMALYKQEKVNPLAGCLDADPNSDLLCAVQGADADDRNAAPALRRLDQGSVRARSVDPGQPVRPAALHPAALHRDRRGADLAGHLDVLPVQDEPAADG